MIIPFSFIVVAVVSKPGLPVLRRRLSVLGIKHVMNFHAHEILYGLYIDHAGIWLIKFESSLLTYD